MTGLQGTPPSDLWQRVLDDAELLGALRAAPVEQRRSPTFLSRLRKRFTADELACALELTDARERAVSKFAEPENAFVDRSAVEQASGLAIARHKAERFRRALDVEPARVFDLCCGAGGDLAALRETCGDVVSGIDRDPLRVAMARHNTGAEVRCDTVEKLLVAGEIDGRSLVHCDPARRTDRGRVWRLEDLIPGPVELRRLLSSARGAAIKLGPGMDPEELRMLGPDFDIDSEWGFEFEWIAEGRSLRQLVLWSGDLRTDPGARRATRIGAFSVTGRPTEVEAMAPTVKPSGFLIEVDPVVERAGLAGAVLQVAGGQDAVRELAPGLGLFVSQSAIDSDCVRSFPVRYSAPWREERVRRRLTADGPGPVAVKTRGGVVDANAVERRFAGTGEASTVLFVLRRGTRVVAIVCDPPLEAEAGHRPNA